jgi:3-deoxy-D-manno-octulosonate 8-phosphate phosphatase (KDO 8-P phosphatase)
VRTLLAIAEQNHLSLHQIAYIGDDMNDEAVLQMVGLSACPADAMEEIKSLADYTCHNYGGHGAFREFAEFIIKVKAFNVHSSLANGQAHRVDTKASMANDKFFDQ